MDSAAVDDIAITCLRKANELVAFVQCCADDGLAEYNGATAGDGGLPESVRQSSQLAM